MERPAEAGFYSNPSATPRLVVCSGIVEIIFGHRRNHSETDSPYPSFVTNGENSVVWDIIHTLYRNYCLARLHEMRKLGIANSECADHPGW